MQWSKDQTFKENIRMSDATEAKDVRVASLNSGGTVLALNPDAISAVTIGGSTLAIEGVIAPGAGILRQFDIVATGNRTVTAAMSGRVFMANAGSGTQTFTLPDAGTTPGYDYVFICGNAGGEILINPHASDKIRIKATEDAGASVAPAAGTGVKNTAATNVVGDHVHLVFDGVDTWHMVGQSGIWASQ